MKKIIIFTFGLFYCIIATAQNIGLGAEAIYNFQTESFGAGARVNIFPNNRLSIVPQFSYYFAFNKVNEYNAGLGLEYKIIRANKFNIYALAHGAYNAWLNHERSEMKDAKQNNLNLEAGAGISTNTCLRPFLEYRYNVKFRETHLNLGLLYIFGCSGGGRGKRDIRCSAYN